MKRLSEELLEYFSNTPEEQLQKDWEAIHCKYAYGPEINQFIEECEKNALRNEIVAGIYGSHPTSRVNVESPISQDFGSDSYLPMAVSNTKIHHNEASRFFAKKLLRSQRNA